jgi:FMN reductase
MTSIVVLSAGLSVPSSTRILADALGASTRRALAAVAQDATVDVIELRDLAHLITDNLLTGFPTGALAEAVRRVAEADAVIAVTPVFAASYSGLFKSFVDVLDDDTLAGKPVLIAATAGTARHSLVLDFAMRPLFAYLRADVVPTGVFAASSDFGSGSTVAGGSLSTRIDRAASELADKVLRRGTALPEDPFVNPTPFEDLLTADCSPSRSTGIPEVAVRHPRRPPRVIVGAMVVERAQEQPVGEVGAATLAPRVSPMMRLAPCGRDLTVLGTTSAIADRERLALGR